LHAKNTTLYAFNIATNLRERPKKARRSRSTGTLFGENPIAIHFAGPAVG
jgi:hypothetical protein